MNRDRFASATNHALKTKKPFYLHDWWYFALGFAGILLIAATIIVSIITFGIAPMAIACVFVAVSTTLIAAIANFLGRSTSLKTITGEQTEQPPLSSSWITLLKGDLELDQLAAPLIFSPIYSAKINVNKPSISTNIKERAPLTSISDLANSPTY